MRLHPSSVHTSASKPNLSDFSSTGLVFISEKKMTSLRQMRKAAAAASPDVKMKTGDRSGKRQLHISTVAKQSNYLFV